MESVKDFLRTEAEEGFALNCDTGYGSGRGDSSGYGTGTGPGQPAGVVRESDLDHGGI